jgi:general nucleoside transport system permease protein
VSPAALTVPGPIAHALRVLVLVGALASGFFLLIGQHPGAMFAEIASAAAGSGYAIGESLLRATPILLCGLATLVPARLGLISVGAEGQLCLGAICGTGAMLAWTGPQGLLLPIVLIGGLVGGALWALVPALLRNAAGVNETISTLMLNYVAALAVTWLVYGPWKNPQSQGWPATVEFPSAARLATLADSRVHAGLMLALCLAALLYFLLERTRWGLVLDVLRSNPRLEHVTGLPIAPQVLLTMAIGGALAGLAGIAEASAVQGRLQPDLSQGAGLSGFLVAWLAGNRVGRTVWLSLLIGGLLASGDGLQMNAQVPSSVTLVVQGLLFVAVLGAGTRWRPGQRNPRG